MFCCTNICPWTLSFYCIFPSSILVINSFNNSSHKTRLFAYKNAINEPCLTFSVRTSITMINKSRLKADPWWTPTFTENELYSSSSSETAVLQPLWREITPFIKYSGTPFCLKVKWITSLGSQSNIFSRSTIIKKQLLIFGSESFIKSFWNKQHQ